MTLAPPVVLSVRHSSDGQTTPGHASGDDDPWLPPPEMVNETYSRRGATTWTHGISKLSATEYMRQLSKLPGIWQVVR